MNTNTPAPEPTTTIDASTPAPAQPPAPEPKRRGRPPKRRPPQVYDSIEDAAVKLSLTVQGLRARCRRNAVREGREIRCYLGDGIVATKFGRSWRVRFPQ